MDVVIRGKNVKVSEPLREAATEHLAKLDRFANGFARAEVRLLRGAHTRASREPEVRGARPREGAPVEWPTLGYGALRRLYVPSATRWSHQVKRLKDKAGGPDPPPAHPERAGRIAAGGGRRNRRSRSRPGS